MAPKEKEYLNIVNVNMVREDIIVAFFSDNVIQWGLQGDFCEALTPIIHHNWKCP